MATPQLRETAFAAHDALETHHYQIQQAGAALRAVVTLSQRTHQADHPMAEIERDDLAALLTLITRPLDEATASMEAAIQHVRQFTVPTHYTQPLQ